MQEAGEDGVQAERSEFIVRAWTPFAASRKDDLAGEEKGPLGRRHPGHWRWGTIT